MFLGHLLQFCRLAFASLFSICFCAVLLGCPPSIRTGIPLHSGLNSASHDRKGKRLKRKMVRFAPTRKAAVGKYVVMMLCSGKGYKSFRFISCCHTVLHGTAVRQQQRLHPKSGDWFDPCSDPYGKISGWTGEHQMDFELSRFTKIGRNRANSCK